MKTYKLKDLRIERKQNAASVAGNIRLLLACKGNIEKLLRLYGKTEHIFALTTIIEKEQKIGEKRTINTKNGEKDFTIKPSQDLVLRWFEAHQEEANSYKEQAQKILEEAQKEA